MPRITEALLVREVADSVQEAAITMVAGVVPGDSFHVEDSLEMAADSPKWEDNNSIHKEVVSVASQTVAILDHEASNEVGSSSCVSYQNHAR